MLQIPSELLAYLTDLEWVEKYHSCFFADNRRRVHTHVRAPIFISSCVFLAKIASSWMSEYKAVPVETCRLLDFEAFLGTMRRIAKKKYGNTGVCRANPFLNALRHDQIVI
jgi:hypothetical protein